MSWTTPTLPSAGIDIVGVAYGAGIWVAVTPWDGTRTSTDGITWTAHAQPTSLPSTGVFFVNGIFVITLDYTQKLGGINGILTCTDGVSWAYSTLPSAGGLPDNYRFVGCAYSPHFASYYLLASNGVTEPGTVLVAASLTATNWSVVGGSGAFPAVKWSALMFIGGQLLAVALNSNQAVISADNGTWTAHTMPATADWTAAAYGGGVVCAVAKGGTTAATSSDGGLTWTARTLPASGDWSSVVWDGTQFVAVASGGTHMATSPDGATWTAATLPENAQWSVIAFANSLYVAAPRRGTQLATSSDAAAWTLRTVAGVAVCRAVVFGAGTFLVMSGTGCAYTSSDGDTWSLAQLPVGLDGRGYLVYDETNAKFVALDTVRGVWTSADGATWAQTAPSFRTNATGVACGNGVLVCCGHFPTAFTSTDFGVTWTSRSLSAFPSAALWDYACFGDGYFVLAASSFSGSGYDNLFIYSSDNGATWYAEFLSGYGNAAKGLAYCAALALFMFTMDSIGTEVWTASLPSGPWSSHALPGAYNDAGPLRAGRDLFHVLPYNSATGGASSDGATWTSETFPASDFWADLAEGNNACVAVYPKGMARLALSSTPEIDYYTASNLPTGAALKLGVSLGTTFYWAGFQAKNGAGAVTSITASNLPAGVTIDGTVQHNASPDYYFAYLKGTPTAVGAFNATLSAGNGTQSANQPWSDTVASNPATYYGGSYPTGAALRVGTALPAASYNVQFQTGTSVPNVTSITATGLPDGLTLGPLQNGATQTPYCYIIGAPTAAGPFVADFVAHNGSDSAAHEWDDTVGGAPPPMTLSGVLSDVLTNARYAATLDLGGTFVAPVTFDASSGTLPAWLGFAVSGTKVNVTGRAPRAAELDIFTLRATDSTTPTAQTATAAQLIQVRAAPRAAYA